MRSLALTLALAACRFRGGAASGSPDGAVPDARPDAPADAIDIPADWWDTSWHARRLITIDNSTVDTALSAFPVLIALDNADNDGRLGTSGADVRFIAADHTTMIPYDVDTSSTAGALFWVPIAIPPAPAQAPTFWVYFDDTQGAGPAPQASAVWSTYVSVHHLADFSDSTGNGHTGTPETMASTPSAATGRIGGALAFDGVDDALPLATTTAYDLVDSLSMSAWIKLSSWTIAWECVVCKGDNAWRIHRGNTTSHADFGTTPASSGSNGNDNLDSSENVDNSQWHLVSVEFDGAHKSIYVDGGTAQTDTESTLQATSAQVVIAHNVEAVSPSDRYFTGDIDELRIGAQLRGATWFATEYRTVTDPGFAQLGAIETIP